MMKWICSHCDAINPGGAFKCHNCPNTCGDEVTNLKQSISEFKEGVQTFKCPVCKQSGIPFYNINLQHELKIAMKALEKIADPRLRDHKEPDKYTELGCVMNIAQEAINKINESSDPNPKHTKE